MNRINQAVAEQIPMPPKCCKNIRKVIEMARAARTEKMIKKVQKLFEAGYPVYVNR